MLRTARLQLRPLETSDAAAIHAVLGDPRAMTAYEGAFSASESLAWIERQQQRYVDDGFGLLAVVDTASGDVIGQAGLTMQSIETERIVEVGYLFRRSAWRHGYATEAASACVSWGFEHLDVDRIWAKVRDTNLASMNVAIRLGMTARRRFPVRYRGVDMPHIAFAVDRATFQAG